MRIYIETQYDPAASVVRMQASSDANPYRVTRPAATAEEAAHQADLFVQMYRDLDVTVVL
jgi:hypothetical protein